MKAFISKYAARLAGVVVGAIAGLLVQAGIHIAPEALAGLEQFITELMVAATLLGYSLIHTWIDHRQETTDG